jgi:catechol 2,3-dioxygenase-like lactoylglutathione lyase family enzyme
MPAVPRVQLALNVDDIDAAVRFYSTLFDAEPAKRRPGYANFALTQPPLKLVLIENAGHGGSLNHLGVEVASTDRVVAETRRLAGAGLPTEVEDGVSCCYALQDKVWVRDPDGAPWEIYTVLADAPASATSTAGEPGCCGSAAADDACCTSERNR